MLSEDEKKVINYLNNKINENKKEIKNIESKNDTSLIGYGTLHDTYKLENWYYLILLNLIEKLQKENKHWKKGFEKELEDNRKNTCELLKQDLIIREKDKQMDLMADEISYLDWGNLCNRINNNCIVSIKHNPKCRECIKQYFEKLAKEKGE